MAAPTAAPVKPVRALFTDFKVFSGTANHPLTVGICKALDSPVGEAMIKRFADGETHLQIQENVRGADVFVVQPTCTPVDQHLMELLLMIDALKRAGKPAQMIVLKREDHWLSHGDTRLQMLQATMDFLARNNPTS